MFRACMPFAQSSFVVLPYAHLMTRPFFLRALSKSGEQHLSSWCHNVPQRFSQLSFNNCGNTVNVRSFSELSIVRSGIICDGCGVPLQSHDKSCLGYIPEHVIAVKMLCHIYS